MKNLSTKEITELISKYETVKKRLYHEFGDGAYLFDIMIAEKIQIVPNIYSMFIEFDDYPKRTIQDSVSFCNGMISKLETIRMKSNGNGICNNCNRALP